MKEEFAEIENSARNIIKTIF